MPTKLKMSSKGQIVVPLAMRRRHGWLDGSEIEAVDLPIGIVLRVVPQRTTGLSIDEALARIRKRSPYHGPPLSIEGMSKAMLDMAEEQDRRSR